MSDEISDLDDSEQENSAENSEEDAMPSERQVFDDLGPLADAQPTKMVDPTLQVIAKTDEDHNDEMLETIHQGKYQTDDEINRGLARTVSISISDDECPSS
jgi:hypothetical protein